MGTAADGLPDETLLAGLGAGDADLALAFVRRFQRIVFGVAMSVIGDPAAAEDVAQQAFVQAWRHAQVYDSRRGSVVARLACQGQSPWMIFVEGLRSITEPRRGTLAAGPGWSVTISKAVLELRHGWQWHNALGQIKDMAARSFLNKLEQRGWIELPPLKGAGVRDLRRAWPARGPTQSFPAIRFENAEPLQAAKRETTAAFILKGAADCIEMDRISHHCRCFNRVGEG